MSVPPPLARSDVIAPAQTLAEYEQPLSLVAAATLKCATTIDIVAGLFSNITSRSYYNQGEKNVADPQGSSIRHRWFQLQTRRADFLGQ